jgi:uncharacterized membrane protein YgcG
VPAVRRRAAAVAALLLGIMLVFTAVAPAIGAEEIRTYDVVITIERSGDLLIKETIRYDFGDFPHHGIFRDVPVRFDYPKKDNTDRVYPLDVISVRASVGTPAGYSVDDVTKNGTGFKEIKIGDPDKTITGVHTYTITYRVKDALNAFKNHDELYWNAIGNEWGVITDQANVTVNAPATIPALACFQGAFGSTLRCDHEAVVDGHTARFSQSRLFPFDSFTVVIAIPKGAVPTPKPNLEERWTLGRAFALNGLTGGIAGGLLLLLIGAYFARFLAIARDRRFKGSPVDQAYGAPGAPEEMTPLLAGHTETPVEFVPPDDLRPGQVGVLVDFEAHPLDVTATIIDLAVRKYLVIEEVNSDKKWLGNDWKLTKVQEPDDKLKGYEQELMKGLFRDGKEVQLSDLKYEFAARMSKVEAALTTDAKKQGWFTKDPSSARTSAGCLGTVVLIVGVVLTVLLAIWTHLALLGVPVILLGLVAMVSAYWAPSRTAKGSALLRHVHGFRRFIEESEKDRAKFAEKKNLFSEYLPYAVVFGAVDKWAHTFAGLAGAPPDTTYWYRSTTPFEYTAFSTAINGFTVHTSGTLTSSPPSTSGSSGFSSGFSGGGFSGGGGGGGGGGSW